MVKINESTEQKQVDVGDGAVFVSNSTTEAGAYYITAIVADSEPGVFVAVCSCKGFRFQNKCWHVDEAASTMADAIVDGEVFALDVQTLLADGDGNDSEN